jgi:heat shock protein HtpX
MAMPKINVIEEASLNAFASGINNKSYTVTVTRGMIDTFEDDELEGVIAHELTHIRNRDVRLLIISIIFVGIFAFAAQILTRSMLWGSIGGRGNKKNNGIVILIGLALVALGYLLSLLMRFAISRNREYMADAGAAQMTKNPLALASALRKISGRSTISAVKDKRVSELFIESALKGETTNLFSTHPPIAKRIRILEQF